MKRTATIFKKSQTLAANKMKAIDDKKDEEDELGGQHSNIASPYAIRNHTSMDITVIRTNPDGSLKEKIKKV